MKINYICSIVLVFLVGCSSSSSSGRSDIVSWAKEIANLETRLEIEVTQFTNLSNEFVSRPPTRGELTQLTSNSNNITAIYNEIIAITPPDQAKSIHAKYIDSYAKTSNYALYYVIAIKQNDLSYFDKSLIAVQDANRIGADAYNDFESLLNDYSISCNEIDFCE